MKKAGIIMLLTAVLFGCERGPGVSPDAITITRVAEFSPGSGPIVFEKDDRSPIHVAVILDEGHLTFAGPKTKEDAIETGKALCVHYKGRMFQLAFGPKYREEFGQFIYSGGAETYLPDGTLSYAKE